jgi:hypothetical protein
MAALEMYGEVKQYSYRTGVVGDIFMEVPRELMDSFEEALAKKAGARPDNHTVYEVKHEEFGKVETTYIWFHDLKAFFGRKLIEGRY